MADHARRALARRRAARDGLCTAPSGTHRAVSLIAMQRPATVSLRTSLFEDATAIIDAEYPRDLALDDIARRVASSRRQVQRAFAEVGQTTFREHVAAVRMDRAARMLTGGQETVREVANRVGYRQPAQFAKAFRKRHGVTPSAYRGTARAGSPSRPEAGAA